VVFRLIAADSIDEHIVQQSGFKAELFDQLTRQSTLADAASRQAGELRDVPEGELLDWARGKYSH
jgi:hypothetical protein